ncbi:MAG: hypothetical protein HY649_08560 [Acidobacteria bacterium]|nr:hypothetical protein [Acidobacteriota bacterium]
MELPSYPFRAAQGNRKPVVVAGQDAGSRQKVQVVSVRQVDLEFLEDIQ